MNSLMTFPDAMSVLKALKCCEFQIGNAFRKMHGCANANVILKRIFFCSIEP